MIFFRKILLALQNLWRKLFRSPDPVAPEIVPPPPILRGATPSAVEVEQYGLFELTLDLNALFANPYDYDEIRVEATFVAPDGKRETVDGFFMQPFQISDPASGGLSPLGSGVFQVRFSPRQTGNWSFTASCTNRGGTATLPPGYFQCTPAAAPQNRGFAHTNPSLFFAFDNGEQYISIGENMAWPQSNAYLDFTRWIDKLTAHGGNFIRIWNCHWGLGLEWLDDGNYAGLKKYHQGNCFYLDWLFGHCAEKGVLVMLCLHHHGQVSTRVNSNWKENPYNTTNGGPCRRTWDFFSNAKARKLVKNRLRYALARWGSQRSLLAWELFNEVDWTDQFRRRQKQIAGWHVEMASFFKKHDLYEHPVSTSFGRDEYAPAIWKQPEIDFTQTHYYVDVPHPERALADGVHRYLDAFGKPTLNAEFGLHPDGGDLARLDPDGIYFHNCLWAPLFSGAAGTGMSWWWDGYVESQNLYRHFAGVAAAAGKLALQARDYRPAPATVQGDNTDAYVLKSADGTHAAGWLLHKLYNHAHVAAQGRPAPLRGAAVQVAGMMEGAYFVQWYDCNSGALRHAEQMTTRAGVLWLSVPELAWDLFFTAQPAPLAPV